MSAPISFRRYTGDPGAHEMDRVRLAKDPIPRPQKVDGNFLLFPWPGLDQITL